MVVNESEALVTMTAVSSDKISTYLADDIHLASESSADSLMSSSGRKRSVTRVKSRFCFLHLDHVSGTTICETQNSKDN